MGFYINADDLEKELRSTLKVNLSDYGIFNYSVGKFKAALKQHSIIQKAKREGYRIDLYYRDNAIYNPDHQTHSYEAAFLADILRSEMLRLGKKFTIETVMSHPAKVEFLEIAQRIGFKNYLYYISTESPMINIERVHQRVKLGGHPVAREKIESRYYRSLENLKPAVQNTYRTFVFDNSKAEPNLILEVFNGDEVTYYHNEIPAWVDKYLLR